MGETGSYLFKTIKDALFAVTYHIILDHKWNK